ncbi:MAG: adhesin transport system outer membrane protein [Halieaceae bacterium]
MILHWVLVDRELHPLAVKIQCVALVTESRGVKNPAKTTKKEPLMIILETSVSSRLPASVDRTAQSGLHPSGQRAAPRRRSLLPLVFPFLLIAAGPALAQTGSTLAQSEPVPAKQLSNYTEAVVHALSVNPTVTSAYYEFEAVRESELVARGGYLPSVDLSGDYSWQDRQTPLRDFGDYESDALRFSITQLLFDGFQTRDEVRSRRYAKMASYYDFHGASQQVALDATDVFLNTVLYQHLVTFAEENYVVHRQVFNKIAERADAGISQRVDFEQASARMALAESNLLTEVTNLHDTRTEFQRVIGLLPGDNLSEPGIPASAMPLSRQEALRVAYVNSPDVNSSIEELRSARESMNATRGPMMPRLDLRYRNEKESNTDGILGDYDLEAVEVVMSYNLYRGGADSARRKEFANRYYSAIERRKEACLNVRRETVIAFNDANVLIRQVSYLEQQLTAQDRTRRAYNDQFDLGQRSLLDLLDSQNEYFDTQRTLISARTRLLLAQARTLATVGALTGALDVQGFNADKLAALELDMTRYADEEIALCPTGFPEAIEIDQEEIFDRLNRQADAAGDQLGKAATLGDADSRELPRSLSSQEAVQNLTVYPEESFLAKPVAGENYRVGKDETLWSIASSVRPQEVSLLDTMETIQRLNPRAFNRGDVDSIKAGYEIYLPTASEIIN